MTGRGKDGHPSKGDFQSRPNGRPNSCPNDGRPDVSPHPSTPSEAMNSLNIEIMKKCLHFNFDCFLTLLRYIIVVLFLFDTGLILYKTFLIIHKGTGLAACTNMFIKWENLQFFLKALFGVVTLYVASRQLHKRSETAHKQSEMACINSLIELRKQLTTGENRNVHFALSPAEDKKTLNDKDVILGSCNLKKEEEIPMIDVFNYLGTLELGIQMVKRKLIPGDTFKNQFGYRLENIFEENSEIHKKVREHINECMSYYEDLFWMRERMKKENNV
jgi:hypothetical protein